MPVYPCLNGSAFRDGIDHFSSVMLQRTRYQRNKLHCPRCGKKLKATTKIIDRGRDGIWCGECLP